MNKLTYEALKTSRGDIYPAIYFFFKLKGGFKLSYNYWESLFLQFVDNNGGVIYLSEIKERVFTELDKYFKVK